jgi:hypothetical protein
MCRFSAPPDYQRIKPIERPTLGPYIGVIDAILSADKQAPPKQRHTAKRIFVIKVMSGRPGGYFPFRGCEAWKAIDHELPSAVLATVAKSGERCRA